MNLETGLVDGRDLVVIAANLQKILDGLPATTSVTFALVMKLLRVLVDTGSVNNGSFFAEFGVCW